MTSVFASFVWLGMSYGGVQSALAIKDSRLKDAQANLDALRTQLGSLSRQQESFQAVLSSTLSSLGINLDNSKASSAGGSGDLASFFNLQDTATGTLQEINSMQQFTDYLAAAEQPIKEMGAVLTTQSSLLTEIPNIWPVAGGAGHISMMFGQNTHPFTGDQYIHKGLDISTFRQGDPILATADGQVVSVDYSPNDFGLYVTIKHKHGFYTRYAHMSSARVVVGQKVQQGDTIGAIGSTGLVTGPHLHYEIHIGSDVVDPYNYMNIRGVSISLNSGGTDAY
jgi:murein DD-endopeptidase MepM/ murein hydrolase activator NlpD